MSGRAWGVAATGMAAVSLLSNFMMVRALRENEARLARVERQGPAAAAERRDEPVPVGIFGPGELASRGRGEAVPAPDRGTAVSPPFPDAAFSGGDAPLSARQQEAIDRMIEQKLGERQAAPEAKGKAGEMDALREHLSLSESQAIRIAELVESTQKELEAYVMEHGLSDVKKLMQKGEESSAGLEAAIRGELSLSQQQKWDELKKEGRVIDRLMSIEIRSGPPRK